MPHVFFPSVSKSRNGVVGSWNHFGLGIEMPFRYESCKGQAISMHSDIYSQLTYFLGTLALSSTST